MTKQSKTARKICFDCKKIIDIRHEYHIIRVYPENVFGDEVVNYYHMDCHDLL